MEFSLPRRRSAGAGGLLQSQISRFPVTSGTTYLLEIIAYRETPGGKLVLNATFTP